MGSSNCTKGKLIVIEACDASGKETQTIKLYERLVKEGYNTRKVEFPNYKSDSSALVKMYLRGEFGNNPSDVNPYVASTFYTVDRFASYKKQWEDFYLNGGVVIADRYSTANMVHQASKIQDHSEKNKFLDWLWDFEFNKFSLPVPDCVVFLDMPPECSQILMKERRNKFTGEQNKDIHEKDLNYLNYSYKNSCYIADKYNWIRIKCVDNKNIRTIDEIHEDVFNSIMRNIKIDQ